MSYDNINFPLTTDSVVLELGGYNGLWSKEINRRYHPNLYIFEPTSSFFNNIVSIFHGQSNVKYFNFGISDKNEEKELCVREDGSSIFNVDNRYSVETIKLRDVAEVFEHLYLKEIDVMQINIEGSEYSVLERMIEKDLLKDIKVLLIQFHTFVENHEMRRAIIQEKLLDTHNQTYNEDFVWEKWELQ